MFISLFNGETIDSLCLSGIEHVISISLGPTPPNLTTDPTSSDLPKVHIRAYTIQLKPSGTRTPKAELTLMGPSFDLVLRRHQPPDPELLKQSLRRPKLKKQDVEKGLGKKKKNLEVDEMGDLRGRVHIAKQDLSKLQTRKMKGLKATFDEDEDEDEDEDDNEDDNQEDLPLQKKQRIS
jgi:ribosome production factor 2